MFITELKTLCNIGDRIHDAQCVVDKIADFILTVLHKPEDRAVG